MVFLLLNSCGDSNLLEEGRKIETFLKQSPLRDDAQINNELIRLYGKCISVSDAHSFFDKMTERNLDSWNLMISGFVSTGKTLHADLQVVEPGLWHKLHLHL